MHLISMIFSFCIALIILNLSLIVQMVWQEEFCGCGLVGRVVASDIRGLWIKSSDQTFI